MLEKFATFLFFVVIVAVILGFPIMWLWNAILPGVTGAATINFWQALGLWVLCNLLFGNYVKYKN